jgi:hypothetical protein
LEHALELFRKHAFSWGVALTELSLGETLVRRGDPRAAELLQRSLTYWTEWQVPALRHRTFEALRHVNAPPAARAASDHSRSARAGAEWA